MAEIKSYKVPLRIFARKSMKEYVEKEKEEFYHATMCGINFYEDFF